MPDDIIKFPETHRDVLEGNNFAQVAMSMPDGRLSNSTVAFIWNGTHIQFSTTKSRHKYKCLMKDQRVAICIPDLKNPLRYLEVRGNVVAEDDVNRDFINSIAKKYMGIEKYPYDKPGDERVTYTVIHNQIRAENLNMG